MKWWKSKYSICSQCEVHFEPVIGPDDRWGHLCSTHRKAVKEQDLRRDAVIAWATVNWERLVQMMENERAQTTAAFYQGLQANYEQESFRRQQQQMKNPQSWVHQNGGHHS